MTLTRQIPVPVHFSGPAGSPAGGNAARERKEGAGKEHTQRVTAPLVSERSKSQGTEQPVSDARRGRWGTRDATLPRRAGLSEPAAAARSLLEHTSEDADSKKTGNSSIPSTAHGTPLHASPLFPDDFDDVPLSTAAADGSPGRVFYESESPSSDEDEGAGRDRRGRGRGRETSHEDKENEMEELTWSYSTTTSTSSETMGSSLAPSSSAAAGGIATSAASSATSAPSRRSRSRSKNKSTERKSSFVAEALRGLATSSAALMTRSLSNASSAASSYVGTPATSPPSTVRRQEKRGRVTSWRGGTGDVDIVAEEPVEKGKGERQRSLRISEKQMRKQLKVLLEPSSLSSPPPTDKAQDAISASGLGLGIDIDMASAAPSNRRASMSLPVGMDEDPLLGGRVGSVEDMIEVDPFTFHASDGSSASSTPRRLSNASLAATSPRSSSLTARLKNAGSAAGAGAATTAEVDQRTGFASLYAMRLSSLQAQLRGWSALPQLPSTQTQVTSVTGTGSRRPSISSSAPALAVVSGVSPSSAPSLLTAGLRQLARLPNLLLNASAFEAQAVDHLSPVQDLSAVDADADTAGVEAADIGKEGEVKQTEPELSPQQQVNRPRPSSRPSSSQSDDSGHNISSLASSAVLSAEESSTKSRSSHTRNKASIDGRGVMSPLEADASTSAYVAGLGPALDPDTEISSVVHLETFRSKYGASKRSPTPGAGGQEAETQNAEREKQPEAALTEGDEREARFDRRSRAGRRASPPSARQCAVGLFGRGRASHSSRRTDANVFTDFESSPGLKVVRSSPDLLHLARAAKLAMETAESRPSSSNASSDDEDNGDEERGRGRRGGVKVVSAAVDPEILAAASRRQVRSLSRARSYSELAQLACQVSSSAGEGRNKTRSKLDAFGPADTEAHAANVDASNHRASSESSDLVLRPRLLSNGSHLLMLSLELEMIRKHKITAPLKPRWGKQRTRRELAEFANLPFGGYRGLYTPQQQSWISSGSDLKHEVM